MAKNIPKLEPFLHNLKQDSLYDLTFFETTSDNILLKEFAFHNIKLEMGKQYPVNYSIENENQVSCSLYSFIGIGDILGNIYILNEADDCEDYLNITYINDTNREIRGEFQVSFYVHKNLNFDEESPDTVLITKGKFEMQIPK